MLEEVEKKIISEGYSSRKAYNLLENLCENFGARFAGSEEEREAADFLADKMKDYGLQNVDMQGFTYEGWERGESCLKIITEESEDNFDCIGLPYSPSEEVEANLVDVGDGKPSEFSNLSEEISGNIVLVSALRPIYAREKMHRRDKYLRAVEAGAKGVIWMREVGGHLAETGGLPHDAPIPAVGVSYETGFKIKQFIQKYGGKILIRTKNNFQETKSYNISGDLTGTESRKNEPSLIVGAHYDGHDIAEGALDNGAGTAVVMEAARLLAPHQDSLGLSIKFVLFAAEEVGLLGSREFVQNQTEEQDYKFMLNLDGAPGRPGSILGLALQGWPELIPMFKDIYSNMNRPDLEIGISPSSHSDMHPFSEAGIASGYFSDLKNVSTGRNWGHTKADTMDKIKPHKLRKDALLLARTLLHLSRMKEWPI